MTPHLSHNTQAILLLTAPLSTGAHSTSAELLTPAEYKRLAIHLRQLQHQPSDLLAANSSSLLAACNGIIDPSRLQRLLGRGFLLGQVTEHWQARSIWVISRADSNYPKRLKAKLKEDAPAILYGCGDIDILDSGGLAVVGSREIDETLVHYSASVGELAADAQKTLISGGARGVDRAAMQGASHKGGRVCEVMAEKLEHAAIHRSNRDMLKQGRLLLVSAYDPNSKFHVGHAMQRNKLIYALCDAALVVNADLKKGGTWAGAIEQLNRLAYVKVYVRATGTPSVALDALREKGALAWPEPKSALELLELTDALQIPDKEITGSPSHEAAPSLESDIATVKAPVDTANTKKKQAARKPRLSRRSKKNLPPPSERLLSTLREIFQSLLTTPMKDTEVAKVLNTSTSQTKLWLDNLVEEGLLDKQHRPARYVLAAQRLFE